jgi:hypothetical protein
VAPRSTRARSVHTRPQPQTGRRRTASTTRPRTGRRQRVAESLPKRRRVRSLRLGRQGRARRSNAPWAHLDGTRRCSTSPAGARRLSRSGSTGIDAKRHQKWSGRSRPGRGYLTTSAGTLWVAPLSLAGICQVSPRSRLLLRRCRRRDDVGDSGLAISGPIVRQPGR